MPWIAYLIHFIAALFLTNGVPHFLSGVSGRPFRTPFVRLSASGGSPTINVVWGWVNFLVAFLLFASTDPLYFGTLADTTFIAAGVLIAGLALAKIFGRADA